MKKIISLILCLMLCATCFVACSNQNGGAGGVPKTDTDPTKGSGTGVLLPDDGRVITGTDPSGSPDAGSHETDIEDAGSGTGTITSDNRVIADTHSTEGGVVARGEYSEVKGSTKYEHDSGDVSGLNQYTSGVLTCGVNNDITKYAYWKTLFAETSQTADEKGIFNQFLEYNWKMSTQNMIAVLVSDGQTPVCGATVTLQSQEQTLFTAVSDPNGYAYLFPALSVTSGTIAAKKGEITNSAQVDDFSQTVQIQLNGASATVNGIIDLMLVIDTTGSMGDELEYLKAEIADVINQVALSNPNVQVRLGLVFYRDHGDEYVTRMFDFNTIEVQQANLSAQSSNGGGDYEEAVDEAIELAVTQGTWSENSTKILVHVLDAPPHDTEIIQNRYSNAVLLAAKKGIRIVPVACSGSATLSQYLLRSSAILTNGRYIFMTDHSGVGGAHEVPDVTEYAVEYLNKALVRVINELHTGVEVKPLSISDPIKIKEGEEYVAIRKTLTDGIYELPEVVVFPQYPFNFGLDDVVSNAYASAGKLLNDVASFVQEYIYQKGYYLVLVMVDKEGIYGPASDFVCIGFESGKMTLCFADVSTVTTDDKTEDETSTDPQPVEPKQFYLYLIAVKVEEAEKCFTDTITDLADIEYAVTVVAQVVETEDETSK